VKRAFGARLAQWGALCALAIGASQACSNTDTPIATTTPANLTIVDPTDGAAITLGCDDTLVVHLGLPDNWAKLQPPGLCGTASLCGSVRVSLLATADGTPLVAQSAATADVQLDLSSVPVSQVRFLKAELLNDALEPFSTPAGSPAVVEISLSVTAAADCAGSAGAGAGGSSGGSAGAAGATGAAGAPASANGGAAGTGAETGDTGGAPSAAGADGQSVTAGAAPL
jgi:hypothetical protein